MLKSIPLVVAMLAASLARAGDGKILVTKSKTYLSAVSCTAAEASRTFVLEGPEGAPGASKVAVGVLGGYGWSKAVLMVGHPAHSAASNIALRCYASEDEGVTFGQLPACTPDGVGGCTYYAAVHNVPVSAVAAMPVRVDIEGHVEVKCVATCTAGVAADTVTITGHLVTD